MIDALADSQEHALARQAGPASIVRRSAARHPAKTAIVFGERSYTYEELNAAVESAAGAFQVLHVEPGDRVAVLGRNSDTYLITWLATQFVGAVHVPLNFMLGPREVAYIVEHAGAKLALADVDLFEVLRKGVEERGADATLGLTDSMGSADGRLDFRGMWGSVAGIEAAVAPRGIAQIAYTSGTESSPKGAMLCNEALMAQYVSCVVAGEYHHDDVTVHALPLYHCAQMHCFLMPGLLLGMTSIVLPGPDPATVIDTISARSATSFFAPPTVWIGLLQHEGFNRKSLGHLRKGYYGASIMPVATVEALIERLPDLRLWNYYGQTELGPLATCLGPDDQLRKPGSAGRPVVNVMTRLVDDDMQDVAVGEVGEIVHRSPQVTSGYFRDQERTEAAFEGGWFHSGDLAVQDADGYITIVDRKKDMINSGGENVSSREVEEELYRHDTVAEVAVVGLPDPRWIESVSAFVVLRQGTHASADELRDFARQQMAPFKVPKRVVFVEALPKNPSGKILKRELRDAYAAHDDSGAGADVAST